MINNTTQQKINQTYTLIDLFAGTGAFSVASMKTGRIKPIFANDIEPSSKIIYDYNVNHELTLCDMHNLNLNDIPDADIITAGFSCQPYSLAGKKLGFEDQRSDVFWRLIDIIKNKIPRIVLMENVRNLLTHDNGNTFKIILQNIKKLGYYVKYDILTTEKHTDIPQGRERIFILCFKYKSDYNKFKFPSEITHTRNIYELIDCDVNDKYYYNDRYSSFEEIKKHMIHTYLDNTIYQYRRYFVRENKSNLCPTLTANMGTGGHNVPLIKYPDGKIRKLTPRECFRFQGFDDTYILPESLSDAKLYSLAGNAVTVSLVYRLLTNIIDILDYDVKPIDIINRHQRLIKLNNFEMINHEISIQLKNL